MIVLVHLIAMLKELIVFHILYPYSWLNDFNTCHPSINVVNSTIDTIPYGTSTAFTPFADTLRFAGSRQGIYRM